VIERSLVHVVGCDRERVLVTERVNHVGQSREPDPIHVTRRTRSRCLSPVAFRSPTRCVDRNRFGCDHTWSCNDEGPSETATYRGDWRGNESRTRDLNLGKGSLTLSYNR
jgi:hypothetical protein